MVRWEPGTRERLAQAALDLFGSRGFEQTTAAEIAESVGLSERTFFRHYADKREVLFAGQALLVERFLAGVAAAPPDAAPLDVVASALRSGAEYFTDERRPFSRARQAVIEQNAALQERETRKMSEVAEHLHDALLARGIPEPAATLAARTGTTVFGVSFAQWIADGETRSLADIETAVLDELRALTA